MLYYTVEPAVTAIAAIAVECSEVVTKGCQILVPYYDKQVPWHENLPHPEHPKEEVKWLPVALGAQYMSESFCMKSPRSVCQRLWLLVMFPANFFSFLVDELARLAVWLTASTPGTEVQRLSCRALLRI